MSQKIPEFSKSFFHGTKAELKVGDHISAGNASNYEAGRTSKYAYVTSNLTVAAWAAELAAGDDKSHIFIVEATGPLEDDPNVTNKRFSGNPTNSFRTANPLVVVGVVNGWVGHSAEEIAARKEALRQLSLNGAQIIED